MSDAPDYSNVGITGIAVTATFLTDEGDTANLLIGDEGNVQSDTVSSVLPTGAAIRGFQRQAATSIIEQVFNSSASAGTNTQSGTVVPAGEVRCVTACYGSNLNKGLTVINFQVQRAGGSVPMIEWLNTTASKYSCWYGEVWLGEGDKVKRNFVGCDAGNSLQFAYSYDKFDV